MISIQKYETNNRGGDVNLAIWASGPFPVPPQSSKPKYAAIPVVPEAAREGEHRRRTSRGRDPLRTWLGRWPSLGRTRSPASSAACLAVPSPTGASPSPPWKAAPCTPPWKATRPSECSWRSAASTSTTSPAEMSSSSGNLAAAARRGVLGRFFGSSSSCCCWCCSSQIAEEPP